MCVPAFGPLVLLVSGARYGLQLSWWYAESWRWKTEASCCMLDGAIERSNTIRYEQNAEQVRWLNWVDLIPSLSHARTRSVRIACIVHFLQLAIGEGKCGRAYTRLMSDWKRLLAVYDTRCSRLSSGWL